MILYIFLSVLFILFNLCDYYLTKRILDRGGIELNPILRKFGVARVKLIVCPFLILAGCLLHWAVLIIPVLAITGACIWNYRVLSKI